jgi:hypothetical protein
MSNISEYVYQFIDKNIDLIDITQYDTDLSIHIERIDNYIKEQPIMSKYLNFIKKIYSSVRYVDCNETIKIYNDNANELIKILSSNPNLVPIYIFTQANNTKSNFYFNLYFLNILKNKGLKFEHIYQRTSEIISILDTNVEIIEDQFKGKELLFIFSDDITYSGSQLNDYVTDYNNEVEIKLDSIKFYLNLLGYSKIAKERIIKNKIPKNIIFPKNAIHDKILNLKELLNNFLTSEINTIDSLINSNDFYKLKVVDGELYYESIFRKIYKLDDETKELLTKPLIYPFFKYPDRKSIIQNFCYLIDIGGYTIDLEELKKDNNITIKKVDDILHENFILDSCNRYQLIIPDIKLKDKIIEIINKNNISDINWLLKLNKISETPTNHIGQINLGELLKEDKKYKKTAVMGLHLIDNCDYKIHDLECNIKCNYSFYKEIEYVNINDEEIEMDKQINIGHLSAIHKKLKNNYKFIINSYLRDQLKEAQIIPLEYQLYTPLRGLDYNLFFSETNRDINRIIKFLTIISYLKNNYQINDYNNICKILIDKINKI